MNTEFGMRHPKSGIGMLLMGALALLTNPVCCVVADGSEQPRWTLSTKQARVYPGESLVAAIECNSPGIAQTSFAGMRIVDANGAEVAPGYVRSQTESERVYADKSEGLYRCFFVVNGWCSTDLVPGKYWLELDLYYTLAAEQQTTVLSDGSKVGTFGPEYSVSVRSPFDIIPMDRCDYEKKLAVLAAMTEPGAQESGSKLERDMACEMLAVAQGDAVVPYQLRIVGHSRNTYYARIALASLVQGGTLAAAQGLVNILSDDPYTTQWIRADIVSAIYDLRDQGDLRVLGVTEAVAQANKRFRSPAGPPVRLRRQRSEGGSVFLQTY
jgi:hypothetical protein